MKSPSYIRILSLALGATAALPAAAMAHGIADSAADKSTADFLPLGIQHMLLGWDHLLFIAGVVLLARTPRRAAKLISLFVAGHSLTLLIATLAGWTLSATLVDVVIALSVVFVGALGVRGNPLNWLLTGTAVFGFGLIHGLGLSTRLQHLGLPEDGLLWRVLAFNVGIEIGQLLALSAMVGIGWLIARGGDVPRLRRTAFGTLVATGLLAAAVLSFPRGENTDTTLASATGCVQRDTKPPISAAGDHPSKRFYEPGDTVPTDNLNHVIGDGFVIVRYHPTLSATDLAGLRRWASNEGSFVIGAPDAEQQHAVRAVTAFRELRCDKMDLKTVTEFRDRWIREVQRRRTS